MAHAEPLRRRARKEREILSIFVLSFLPSFLPSFFLLSAALRLCARNSSVFSPPINPHLPNKRPARRYAHKPRPLHHFRHLPRRMDKRLELVSFPPPHKVLITKHQPHIPPVARVGERQDLLRMRGCGAEQRFRIGIA